MSSDLAIDFNCPCKYERPITHYHPNDFISGYSHISYFPFKCKSCTTRAKDYVQLPANFTFASEEQKNYYARIRNTKHGYMQNKRERASEKKEKLKNLGDLEPEKFEEYEETPYVEPEGKSLTRIGYTSLELVISFLDFYPRKCFCSMNKRLADYFIRSDFSNLRINLKSFITRAAFPERETRSDILKKILKNEPLYDNFHDNLFLIVGMHGSFCDQIEFPVLKRMNKNFEITVEYADGSGFGKYKIGDFDEKSVKQTKTEQVCWVRKNSSILKKANREHVNSFKGTNFSPFLSETDLSDLSDERMPSEKKFYFNHYDYDEQTGEIFLGDPFNDEYEMQTVTVCRILVTVNKKEVILNRHLENSTLKKVSFDTKTGNFGSVYCPEELIYIRNPMLFKAISRNPFFTERAVSKRKEAIVGRINLFNYFRSATIDKFENILINYQKEPIDIIEGEINLITTLGHLTFLERYIGFIGDSERLPKAILKVKTTIEKFQKNSKIYFMHLNGCDMPLKERLDELLSSRHLYHLRDELWKNIEA